MWQYIKQIEESIKGYFIKLDSKIQDSKVGLVGDLDAAGNDLDLLFLVSGKAEE